MTYSVSFSRAADDDLSAIYDWIADRADPNVALGYIERIEVAAGRLTDFPCRGSPRDDLGAGLRSIAFERRATIVYRIDGDRVTIVRVVFAGRDMERLGFD